MCGRFVSTTEPEALVSLLDVTRWDPAEALAPSWNVAPTDLVPAVLERVDPDTGEVVRELRSLRWGLVPSWAKDRSGAARLINARSETVDQKPSFRKAFTTRRCVIPADGYYEWRPVPAAEGRKTYKQPYFLSTGGVLLMAGLYEFWRDASLPEDHPEAWLATATVLTTAATGPAARVHDRMPLLVPRAGLDSWLDPATTDRDELRQLLDTPAEDFAVRAVPTAVNRATTDGPELLTAAADPLGIADAA
ncbi:SOS response-associated peptidase [Kitasatospora sp. NPDC088391]|uniref:SOS response-associated peptidase n=1 Tax=Kitasatospora sp. NPDC088391 TaxID=3364074 RepID=UPI0038061375